MRDELNPERHCFIAPAQPYHLFTEEFANNGDPELTFVSRPVYPEPGQIVVALDAEQVATLRSFIEEHECSCGYDDCPGKPKYDKLIAVVRRVLRQSL